MGKVSPRNELPGYDSKLNLMVKLQPEKLWWTWSILSLPLLPGPLWSREVELDRELSMGQIEQFVVQRKDWCLIELLVLHTNTCNHLTVYKRMSNIELIMLNSNTWNRLCA